jgi:hypothetical protein
MTNTYTPLATITLTSTDSEIVFASIPATYRDLIVVANAAGTGSQAVKMKLNGATSGYSFVTMWGTGSGSGQSAAYGSEAAANAGFGASIGTSLDWNLVAQIMDYSATDKHKTILMRANRASTATEASASRYASNNAVNSVSLYIVSNNFAIGSTFSLYGVIA